MNAMKHLLPVCLVALGALAGCRADEPAPLPDPPAPAADAVAPPANDAPPPPRVVGEETTHEETERDAPEMPPGTEATPDPEPER